VLENCLFGRNKFGFGREIGKCNPRVRVSSKELHGFTRLEDKVKPPIGTRLGIRLIDFSGGRYSDNYLWVTGEIYNAGNLTAFDVKLVFKLYTDNGTQAKQHALGTLKPHQNVSVRLTVWSEIGTIKTWDLETTATYEP